MILFHRIIERWDWLYALLISPKLNPQVSALEVLARKQRIRKQLLTFNKEEIVFQQRTAGFHVLVTGDS